MEVPSEQALKSLTANIELHKKAQIYQPTVAYSVSSMRFLPTETDLLAAVDQQMKKCIYPKEGADLIIKLLNGYQGREECQSKKEYEEKWGLYQSKLGDRYGIPTVKSILDLRHKYKVLKVNEENEAADYRLLFDNKLYLIREEIYAILSYAIKWNGCKTLSGKNGLTQFLAFNFHCAHKTLAALALKKLNAAGNGRTTQAGNRRTIQAGNRQSDNTSTAPTQPAIPPLDFPPPGAGTYDPDRFLLLKLFDMNQNKFTDEPAVQDMFGETRNVPRTIIVNGAAHYASLLADMLNGEKHTDGAPVGRDVLFSRHYDTTTGLPYFVGYCYRNDFSGNEHQVQARVLPQFLHGIGYIAKNRIILSSADDDTYIFFLYTRTEESAWAPMSSFVEFIIAAEGVEAVEFSPRRDRINMDGIPLEPNGLKRLIQNFSGEITFMDYLIKAEPQETFCSQEAVAAKQIIFFGKQTNFTEYGATLFSKPVDKSCHWRFEKCSVPMSAITGCHEDGKLASWGSIEFVNCTVKGNNEAENLRHLLELKSQGLVANLEGLENVRPTEA